MPIGTFSRRGATALRRPRSLIATCAAAKGSVWLDPAESETLDTALDTVDGTDDPTAVRSRLLAEVLPTVTTSSCAAAVSRG